MRRGIEGLIDYSSIIFISNNLGIFLKSGIGISTALDELQHEVINKRYKKSLKGIKESVSNGNSIYESFLVDKNLYPPIFLMFLNIGEYTGNLDKIILSVGDYYKKTQSERKKLINSLIYPVSVMVSIFIFIIMYLIFLLPNMEEMYIGMEKPITGILETLIQFSKYVNNNLQFVLILFFTTPIIIWLILSFPLIKSLRKKIKSEFKIINLKNELFFIRILYLISISGISLNSGIQKLIEIDGEISKDEIERFYAYITEGNSISESINQCFKFSRLTSSLISIGESTGNLDEKLLNIIENLEERYYSTLTRYINLVQPILLLILGIVVAGLAALVYGSMYGGMV